MQIKNRHQVSRNRSLSLHTFLVELNMAEKIAVHNAKDHINATIISNERKNKINLIFKGLEIPGYFGLRINPNRGDQGDND